LDALVMAGGKGSRLNRGEKPLVRLFGRPLIEFVVSCLTDSLAVSEGRILVATTNNVPLTSRWARERELEVVETAGKGFVPDMVEAVNQAGVKEPILVIMADLPLVTPDLIDQIIEIYDQRPEPALSTHTPLHLHTRMGRRPDTLFNYQGQFIVPSGINILEGANISDEQEDYHLIMERIELALNVNVTEDLKLCELIMQGDL
jgi:adenosylcobinamide-phosphate guanylyltransferase